MKKPYTAVTGKLITAALTYMISLSAVGQGVGSVVESQGITLGNQARSSSNSDAFIAKIQYTVVISLKS